MDDPLWKDPTSLKQTLILTQARRNWPNLTEKRPKDFLITTKKLNLKTRKFEESVNVNYDRPERDFCRNPRRCRNPDPTQNRFFSQTQSWSVSSSESAPSLFFSVSGRPDQMNTFNVRFCSLTRYSPWSQIRRRRRVVCWCQIRHELCFLKPDPNHIRFSLQIPGPEPLSETWPRLAFFYRTRIHHNKGHWQLMIQNVCAFDWSYGSYFCSKIQNMAEQWGAYSVDKELENARRLILKETLWTFLARKCFWKMMIFAWFSAIYVDG